MSTDASGQVVLLSMNVADAATSSFLSRHTNDAQALNTLLNDVTETNYVLQYRHLIDRQRSLAGKLLARYVISTSYDLNWHEIAFQRSENGKPRAKHDKLPSGYDYNIAHDGDWVVLVAYLPSTVPLSLHEARRVQQLTSVKEEGAIHVGIDVMKIAVPWQDDSVEGFVQVVAPQASFAPFYLLLFLSFTTVETDAPR
ncbi:hypothetical protein ACM66B_005676 [Microbotryomycetes sp. NB124-2]